MLERENEKTELSGNDLLSKIYAKSRIIYSTFCIDFGAICID